MTWVGDRVVCLLLRFAQPVALLFRRLIWCTPGIYFYRSAIFSMFGTSGYYYYYYYYYYSVRIFVICLHFVPSCFFFDKKLCSICVILLNLCADLATGTMLLSLHISKLRWVEMYHEYNQEQIISLINFSSTIVILLMLPLDVISFYFFYVFSTVLMLLIYYCCDVCVIGVMAVVPTH